MYSDSLLLMSEVLAIVKYIKNGIQIPMPVGYLFLVKIMLTIGKTKDMQKRPGSQVCKPSKWPVLTN